MILWLDAQLSPYLVPWIADTFSVQTRAIRDVGLRDARDMDIFMAARAAEAVVVTKDADFPKLLHQHGPPPKVLWVTCGNSSNARLMEIFRETLPAALRLLAGGEPIVEIADAH